MLRQGSLRRLCFYRCLSVHWGGGCPGQGPGEVCVSQHALRQTPPPQADGYCRRRYTSYWNAFLLHLSVNKSVHRGVSGRAPLGKPPWADPPPPRQTPPSPRAPRDGHCSGSQIWLYFRCGGTSLSQCLCSGIPSNRRRGFRASTSLLRAQRSVGI